MKFPLASVLAVLAMAMAVTGVAQTETPDYTGPTQTVTGVVVSSSGTSLVIRSDAGTQQTFMVDSASNLPSGLAAGSRVTVNYHTMDGGKFHVATVTMADTTGRTPPTDTTADLDTRADTTPTDDRPLPATASDEPLVLIAGLIALGMGLALRRAMRSQHQG